MLLKNPEIRAFINQHEQMIEECFTEINKKIEESKETSKEQKRKHASIKIDIKEYFIEFLMDTFGVETEKMKNERILKNKTKLSVLSERGLAGLSLSGMANRVVAQ